MHQSAFKTPVHLWIVGILSLLWNAIGAFDYTATQYRLESYMSHFTPEQIEYFSAFPAWMDAAWAVGVWGSLFGSIALLARKAFAAWLFGISILGLAASSVYNFVLSDGASVMGSDAVKITVVVWGIVLFLYFYSSSMATRRVLS
jgi:hypothetical protein